MSLHKTFINEAKLIFGNDYIPLHRPIFNGNEKKYLIDCIDSNFVSSVGEKVSEFEERIAKFTGSRYAVATVNGTSALQVALKLAHVKSGDEVITQALTFIATCNAIRYVDATPVLIDVDIDTMGMSAAALKAFLEANAEKRANGVFNKLTGKQIRACIPMHTFGFPCRINEISNICSDWGITLIEDAAESLGSYVKNKHTGTFGLMGTLSFNGNKLITTGGGGMIITNDQKVAQRAKHITTTAKINHPYEFIHDEVGYNFRMPNINAALGCAQMEQIKDFILLKKELSKRWNKFFDKQKIKFFTGIDNSKPNFWLNTILLDSFNEREEFLKITNINNVMTRPIWKLMSQLEMFKNFQNDGLKNSLWLQDRVVNIPSSVPNNKI